MLRFCDGAYALLGYYIAFCLNMIGWGILCYMLCLFCFVCVVLFVCLLCLCLLCRLLFALLWGRGGGALCLFASCLVVVVGLLLLLVCGRVVVCFVCVFVRCCVLFFFDCVMCLCCSLFFLFAGLFVIGLICV